MKKNSLFFEEQAYSEAADYLYSRGGDCQHENAPNELGTMSNAYHKIAARLDKKAASLQLKLRQQDS